MMIVMIMMIILLHPPAQKAVVGPLVAIVSETL